MFRERISRRAITNTNYVLTYVTAVTKEWRLRYCKTGTCATGVLVRDVPLTLPVKIEKNKREISKAKLNLLDNFFKLNFVIITK